VRHDQRRGTGDGDEADLQVLLLQRAGRALGHRLQAGERQHAADGRHRRVAAHGPQEAAAQRVLREQRLHQRRFDKAGRFGLEVGGLAAGAQLGGGVVGRAGVLAAGAVHQQGPVGVVGIVGHRVLLRMGATLGTSALSRNRGGRRVFVGVELPGKTWGCSG